MQLIEVTTAPLGQAFLKMPLHIYANDKNYIRPLDKDILEVFDPIKNKYFKQGECIRWLLQDDKGKYIGRIAAFTNKKYKQTQATGGFGFFECINDVAAAHLLLTVAKNWLAEKGMQAMDGPINFGERDKWWGLLLEGFDEPLYGLNYNPPYYKNLIEQFGCQIFYNQVCFGMTHEHVKLERFENMHAHYAKDPDFKTEYIKLTNLDKYAEDFCTVYNAAFAGHGEGKTMDVRVAKGMFRTMKDVMDEKISWFVYYKNEPIAVWLNLPDLNQYFKHFNGRLGIIEKLRFLYFKKFKKVNRFVGLVFGVVPRWQGKGTEALMIVEVRKHVIETGTYNKFEMQWIGDFNPRMLNLASNLDAVQVRKLATYRLLFDPTIEFKRHPILK
jgi:hypothetical protein